MCGERVRVERRWQDRHVHNLETSFAMALFKEPGRRPTHGPWATYALPLLPRLPRLAPASLHICHPLPHAP